jgi:hypothetical protein
MLSCSEISFKIFLRAGEVREIMYVKQPSFQLFQFRVLEKKNVQSSRRGGGNELDGPLVPFSEVTHTAVRGFIRAQISLNCFKLTKEVV